MQDLSLHILDIMENSIRAKASLIELLIREETEEDRLTIRIEDNGQGMAASFVKKATDPFVTTRTTRKVGLGLSLLKQHCLQSEGTFDIYSRKGKGTRITATMQYHHIDRLPLGDVPSSLCVLIQANPKTDIVYTHQYNDKQFVFSTVQIKEMLQGVPINELEIIAWLREYLTENIEAIEAPLSHHIEKEE